MQNNEVHVKAFLAVRCQLFAVLREALKTRVDSDGDNFKLNWSPALQVQ